MLTQPWEVLWAETGIDTTYREALQALLAPNPSVNRAAPHSPPLTALPGLCCVAAGGEPQRTEVFTAAWTLLYAALHLLDSVEDGDVPDASWAHWEAGAAINLSTGLLASAGAVLGGLEGAGANHATAHVIRDDFFRTLLQMTAGQHADLTLAEPTLEQCWQIAERKSGIFFALACRSGARLHTVDPPLVETFSEFGLRLGLLIQIGDDLEGLRMKEGAPSDLVAWPRWTLPAAYAMAVTSPVERERLRSALQAAPADPDAEAEARRLIVAAGAILYLVAEVQRHQRRAQAALLRAASSSSARDDLMALLRRYTPMAEL
jgi:geranylgeranyl pyrophosphate synthase